MDSSAASSSNHILQNVQIGEWSRTKWATLLFRPSILVCILKRNTLILLLKKLKPQKPFKSLPISNPIIVCVFSAYVTIFWGISSGTGSERIFLYGLLPFLNLLQKVFNSTHEPGGTGLTMFEDIVSKHLRTLLNFSIGIWKPIICSNVAWSKQL